MGLCHLHQQRIRKLGVNAHVVDIGQLPAQPLADAVSVQEDQVVPLLHARGGDDLLRPVAAVSGDLHLIHLEEHGESRHHGYRSQHHGQGTQQAAQPAPAAPAFLSLLRHGSCFLSPRSLQSV